MSRPHSTSSPHYALYFCYWIAGLVTLGTILGIIGFIIGGWLLDSEKSLTQLIKGGARFGSFYFLIWAPAIALCATVMREYRRRQSLSRTPPTS